MYARVRMSMCTCPWVWMHSCLSVYVYAELKGKCEISSSIALHLIFWDKLSHSIWSSLFSLAWLSREPSGSICLYLPVRDDHLDAGDLNWGPHVCEASHFTCWAIFPANDPVSQNIICIWSYTTSTTSLAAPLCFTLYTIFWMTMVPKGSYIWMLVPQLVELFGRD